MFHFISNLNFKIFVRFVCFVPFRFFHLFPFKYLILPVSLAILNTSLHPRRIFLYTILTRMSLFSHWLTSMELTFAYQIQLQCKFSYSAYVFDAIATLAIGCVFVHLPVLIVVSVVAVSASLPPTPLARYALCGIAFGSIRRLAGVWFASDQISRISFSIFHIAVRCLAR